MMPVIFAVAVAIISLVFMAISVVGPWVVVGIISTLCYAASIFYLFIHMEKDR